MPRSDESPFLWVAVCLGCCLAGFAVAALVYGSPHLDQPATGLYRWQTLISGVLALAAALATLVFLQQQATSQREDAQAQLDALHRQTQSQRDDARAQQEALQRQTEAQRDDARAQQFLQRVPQVAAQLAACEAIGDYLPRARDVGSTSHAASHRAEDARAKLMDDEITGALAAAPYPVQKSYRKLVRDIVILHNVIGGNANQQRTNDATVEVFASQSEVIRILAREQMLLEAEAERLEKWLRDKGVIDRGIFD